MKEELKSAKYEILKKDKKTNYQNTFSNKELYNPSNLAFEINTMKNSENKENIGKDVNEQSTNIYDTQYFNENHSINMRKLGNHLAKRLLPKSFKLPFLCRRTDSPLQTHLTSSSSHNGKSNIEYNYEFQYRKIFLNKRYFANKQNNIENKLNIDYAESEKQYEERLLKINKKRREKGLRIKHENKSNHLDVKLQDLQEKMRFMKGVVNYSYPSFVVKKIKEINKVLKEELKISNEKHNHNTPYEIRNNMKKIINEKRKTFLAQSIQIIH